MTALDARAVREWVAAQIAGLPPLTDDDCDHLARILARRPVLPSPSPRPGRRSARIVRHRPPAPPKPGEAA